MNDLIKINDEALTSKRKLIELKTSLSSTQSQKLTALQEIIDLRLKSKDIQNEQINLLKDIVELKTVLRRMKEEKLEVLNNTVTLLEEKKQILDDVVELQRLHRRLLGSFALRASDGNVISISELTAGNLNTEGLHLLSSGLMLLLQNHDGEGLDDIDGIMLEDPDEHPPASEEAIEGLSVVKNEVMSELIERSSCSICYEGYKVEDVAVGLPCEHVYHKECVRTWLMQHNSCPICRASI